jgi:hypothetical protein
MGASQPTAKITCAQEWFCSEQATSSKGAVALFLDNDGMLKFPLEYHSFKKMSPSTRTTVIVAIISIFVLLIPYLPIRRGSPSLLSPIEPVSSTTSLNERPPPPSAIEELRAKDSDIESEYTAAESFNSPPTIEDASVVDEPQIEEKIEREMTESRDSEQRLQTDSLDDLDSFLDSEQ